MLLYHKIIELLNQQKMINQSILDPLEANEPSIDDTISELIYKLSCVTNQMWYSQDILYRIRFMSEAEFIETYGENSVELHRILKRACDLNVQRAHLMDAIDQKMIEIRSS
jgi:uncharacterized protein YfkK (UPF0435 family)